MIEYRLAGPRDVAALSALRAEFMGDMFAQCDADMQARLREAAREYFAGAISRDEFAAWLALKDGEIIATSGVAFYTRPPSVHNPSGKFATIMNMYTRPAYRGRGVARELFGRVMQEARAHGCEKITLNATDMGRPLYEKFGFAADPKEMSYYFPRP